MGRLYKCYRCDGVGDTMQWTARCFSCHMDSDSGIGCCVRRKMVSCGLCEGSGKIPRVDAECDWCGKSRRPLKGEDMEEKGWKVVRRSVGDTDDPWFWWCDRCVKRPR